MLLAVIGKASCCYHRQEHTPEMVEASASEYAMENALNFAKGLSLTAAELMARRKTIATNKY